MGEALNTRGTNRSGTIAAANTAQQLAAENGIRRGLTIQNIDDTDMWVNELGGTAAINSAGSYKLAPGAVLQVGTINAISIICSTISKKFTAVEYS